MQRSIVAENAVNYLPSSDKTAVVALALAFGMTTEQAEQGCAALGGPMLVREAARPMLVQAFGEDAASRIMHWRVFLQAVSGVPRGTVFRSSRDVGAYLSAQAELLTTERVWMLCLNARQRLISTVLISEGNECAAPIDIRVVARAALGAGAIAVVLVHNHPSGDLNPSREDIEATSAVAKAMGTIGVKLVDHIIAGATQTFSMLDAGMMP